MIPTEIRLSPLESPLTLMGGKLASNSATTFDGRGEIEKKGFRDPGISSESAPETIDLGWIEAPEEPQAYASPIKFGVARLVRAVEQAKLANTLTGVLKAAFVNGQASPSGCVVDSSGAVIGGGGWAWMVPGSELGVGETTRMGAGERSVWAAQPLKTASRDEIPSPNLATCEVQPLVKLAIQIPAGDIEKQAGGLGGLLQMARSAIKPLGQLGVSVAKPAINRRQFLRQAAGSVLKNQVAAEVARSPLSPPGVRRIGQSYVNFTRAPLTAKPAMPTAQKYVPGLTDMVPAVRMVRAFQKQAIQIPAGWQPRPMIDIQKMILKPAQGLTTPLGASIKAHDATQAEASAKAKPEAQAGTGTSVGPGNSPNIHPITSYSGLGQPGTVNGNAAFGTANSSMKSAAELPAGHPWSGTAIAQGLQAGLDMSVPADQARADLASTLDLHSFMRREARRVPKFGPSSAPPIPGAGTLLPDGPQGKVLPPYLQSINPLVKPQLKLDRPTMPPVPPNPGKGLPGTNAIESPLAGSVPGSQLKVAETGLNVLRSLHTPSIKSDDNVALPRIDIAKGNVLDMETHIAARKAVNAGNTLSGPTRHVSMPGAGSFAPGTAGIQGRVDPPGTNLPRIVPVTSNPDAAPGRGLPGTNAIESPLAAAVPQVKVADLLPGGKGDNKPDSAFASSSLLKGIQHETEHTKRRPIAKEIAKDHLTEDPAYYRKLEQVEKVAVSDELLGAKSDMAGSLNATPKVPPKVPLPPSGTSMSPLHQLPVGEPRVGQPMPNRDLTLQNAAPYQSGIRQLNSIPDLFAASSVMHTPQPRQAVFRHLTQQGYQPNNPAEKLLYERSLGGGAQPPITSNPQQTTQYGTSYYTSDMQTVDEGMNLRPHHTADWQRQQPHVLARHEAEHAKQNTVDRIPQGLLELGPSVGDVVHTISADRMTRGQDLPTTLDPLHIAPDTDGRLNLHQFARQARADGWPQVSMTELLMQPNWSTKRRQLSEFGRRFVAPDSYNATRVLYRGQDPNLKMPQPLLKSSSVQELWNHPARPVVTQAVVGAGTSLALNEIMRRAIEAYQNRPTDPETVHRERLMAAGMGAGMGISRELMPRAVAAAKPYVQSLLT